MFQLEEKIENAAKIKVIGIGGGGGNAVNTMIASNLQGIDFIAANTDLQALGTSLAPTKIQLGAKLTKGLGAGSDPEIGRQAAIEDSELIGEMFSGSDMIFITAGMGGGTGTGAAPVIANIARELGALTVAVVTKPFIFEGRQRARNAEEGIKELKKHVDTVITIPNQRLFDVIDRNTSVIDAFRVADDVLRQAVQGISDLIMIPGLINLDFADVKTIMYGMGRAVMGTGKGSGENRALEAAQKAIASPLIEEGSINGAKGVLINITGGTDLSLYEVNEASTLIQEAADDEANIIFGSVINPDMKEDVVVTVIATGFDGKSNNEQSSVRPISVVSDIHVKKTVSFPKRSNGEVPRSVLSKDPDFIFNSETSLFDKEELEREGIEYDDDLDVPTFIRRRAEK
ncbi:MAG: cell division protein FtsZ [Nitrospirota bacterium]